MFGPSTKTATVGLASILTSMDANTLSVALFNVPVTVMGMALGGAALSFAYGDNNEEVKGRKLFVQILGNTIFSVCSVAVLPRMIGWDWVTPALEPPFALLVAASSRWFIPALIQLPKELLNKWFKLGKYNKDSEEQAITQEDQEGEYEDLPAPRLTTKRKTKQ